MTNEKKEFVKKLMSLVLPIAFGQFMLALVSASDAVMLGMLNQDALSAVSLAGQVQFVLNLFLNALNGGASALMSQYWGKGDREAIERLFAGVLRVTMIISLAFFLAAECIPGALMRIFTEEEVLIAGGVRYLRVVGLSYLLCSMSQMYLCVLKNSEHAGTSTLISSAAVVVNIVLNAIFIFGFGVIPAMGIEGAALATVLARLLELAWAVGESLKKDRLSLKLRYLKKVSRQLMKDFWKYTSSMLANSLAWGLGFTMYSVIMGHLGSDAVAANSITTIVKNLIACFCLGLGSGGGILVGNLLGAGKLEKAKEYGDRLCRLSIISGLVSGGVLVAVTPLVLAVTNLSPQADTYLRWMIVMCAMYLVGKAYNATTIGGIFCAGGDTRFGFYCDTVTMWCVTVPLGLISAFVLDWPVLVVYLIVNMDEVVKLPVVVGHYKKYLWAKNLTR